MHAGYMDGFKCDVIPQALAYKQTHKKHDLYLKESFLHDVSDNFFILDDDNFIGLLIAVLDQGLKY